MAKLTLYHAAPSRSSIVRWMLEEIGEPYEIQLLSLSKGENRAPDYLAVNPMGKVPALRHGDAVITEAAAICAYLADEFPRAKLNVRTRVSTAAEDRPPSGARGACRRRCPSSRTIGTARLSTR